MKNGEIENDIVLAKFIRYIQKALYHRRLNYYRNMQKIREYETSINDLSDTEEENTVITDLNMDILNNKERELVNLHYNLRLSYEQISEITGEKICTLKQRRNRAIAKLKKYLEE